MNQYAESKVKEMLYVWYLRGSYEIIDARDLQSAEAAHSRRGSDKAPNLGAFPADFIIAFTCREGYLEAIRNIQKEIHLGEVSWFVQGFGICYSRATSPFLAMNKLLRFTQAAESCDNTSPKPHVMRIHKPVVSLM